MFTLLLVFFVIHRLLQICLPFLEREIYKLAFGFSKICKDIYCFIQQEYIKLIVFLYW